MAQAVKWDLQWSPTNPNAFIAFGTDYCELNLYTVETVDRTQLSKSQTQQISKEAGGLYASLRSSKTDLCVSSKAELQDIRCFAWHPKYPVDEVLAVGLSSGKVLLTSFSIEPSAVKTSLVGLEFSVKHNKVCTGLAWNTVESKWLAASFDKHRTDYCIAVYDVQTQTRPSMPIAQAHNFSHAGSRSLTEIVQGEVVNSMAWFPHQPTCIVAGVSNKNLRIFDIRDTSGYKSATATKSVHGLAADPHVEYRLASYYEGQVNLWDRRHFDKPVLTINEARPIVKLAWSPSRYGLLAALSRDSSVVKLYNIQHVCNEVEYTERLLQPSRAREVSMFAWHPTCENRILTVTPTGNLRDVTIHDPISLALSPQSTCMLASGRNLLLVSPSESNQVQDISAQMQHRAVIGYGLQDSLSRNGDLLGDSEEDVELGKLWKWLDRITLLRRETTPKGVVPVYHGVKSLIKKESGLKSTVEVVDWKGVDLYSESNIFRSPERTAALKLCGWAFCQDDSSLESFIKRLETESVCERAAAIAVFLRRIRKAIDLLNRSAEDTTANGDVNLSAIAMALSGFTQQRNTLWCEMCSSIRTNLKNPYLRAMFGFLTAGDQSFDVVLKEPGISMEDRVAFACLYLNDQKLSVFIEELTSEAVQQGLLEGLLLAGLTKDGIELMQSYVDRTTDVQTASWVAVQAFTPELRKDRHVLHWIESYRTLLDTWRLWHQRARFDVFFHQGSTRLQSPQIFVNCNFCQNAISPTVLAQRSVQTTIPHLRGPVHQRVKATTCYKCRKPLPRCALCLMNMGTLSGLKSAPPQSRYDPNVCKMAENNVEPEPQSKQTDFDEWFTWCQTCRHGGHASHLKDWFVGHAECPVTGCTCRCMLMDTVGAVTPAGDAT